MVAKSVPLGLRSGAGTNAITKPIAITVQGVNIDNGVVMMVATMTAVVVLPALCHSLLWFLLAVRQFKKELVQSIRYISPSV